MQGNSKRPTRKRASTPDYVSPNQLVLLGFETPFEQKIYKENRWVRLAHSIYAALNKTLIFRHSSFKVEQQRVRNDQKQMTVRLTKNYLESPDTIAVLYGETAG